MRHKWALDIVVNVYEWQNGRWVATQGRLVTADPDKRER